MEMYSALEICLAAEKVCRKETILGAQGIRGMWRIYPLSYPARSQLLIEGLNLRGHALSLYDKNSFILKGQDGKERRTTKLWISDIPLSCDGAEIESVIVKLGCVLRSALIFEKIRNKDGKLTRFLTGRRFDDAKASTDADEDEDEWEESLTEISMADASDSQTSQAAKEVFSTPLPPPQASSSSPSK